MKDITEYAIEVTSPFYPNGHVIEVEFRKHEDAIEYKNEWLQYCDDPDRTTVKIMHRRVRYFDWHLTTG